MAPVFDTRTSTTPTVSLVARMTIPTIGEVPRNDPVVWVSIVVLLSMIVLAFFLVFWIQRRSANEVWDSVKNKGQFRHLRGSSHFPAASERPSWEAAGEIEQGLVRISHHIPLDDSDRGSDKGSDVGSEDGEITEEEGDALAAVQTPKFVQFSEPPHVPQRNLARTPPLSAFDGFETTYDQFQASKMVDAEDSDLGVNFKRASMNERQFHEMHLRGQ